MTAPVVRGPSDWPAVAAILDGVALPPRHAVLTACGTWQAPGQGYASNTVDGLNTFGNDQLCYEVAIPYPASFGPLPPGAITAQGYQQSIDDGVAWVTGWLADNPTQTFALGGYSQGAELVSRVAIEVMSGSLTRYLPNFIGGYTFGNPSRMAGSHAPGTADPGGRGISSVNMTSLPVIDGQTVWADYVHSKANDDAALDMYSSVPTDQVGTDMTDVYAGATELQFNNLQLLSQDFVTDLIADLQALFPTPTAAQLTNSAAWTKLLTDALAAMSNPAAWATLWPDLLSVYSTTDFNTAPTGLTAAIDAAFDGIAFLAAPGGPTAPHTSYLGEIPGYSNLVALSVGLLQNIATLTPARN